MFEKFIFKRKVRALVVVILRIEKQLSRFESSKNPAYVESLYRAFSSLSDKFMFFVRGKDRFGVLDVLSRIQAIIYEIGSACTKGEMDFVSKKDLDLFWKLKPVFQEKRFKDMNL
ncbi:MAG: hypothetical protein COU07_01735 [Candidatus Harrisonbacteria bacterium CG10_big_fil_rev_8_21_14_0_10_40_38]|uniref:Uncharacterized protein n=1 Tax=Candidatus Harrisonbacteria bacterium CG10_big_fil_rev_8_21_14_0_10_40_38 TaxID=1974583 RepID=A0A2H0UT51_9BACT|nr:MAG: hypothetical protein COU07_01735 [Candidatus Harrisonbacteria bacterium CG10_big_fil_rev_8_21_14_0_10_40_38]